jgi:O-Antigen ligase
MSIDYSNHKAISPSGLSRSSIDHSDLWLIVAVGVHAPLAYLIYSSHEVAIYYPIALFALGIWFLICDQEPFRLIFLTGYLAGAEVLCRMTKISIFWEFSKYAIGLLMILSIIKRRSRIPVLPYIYFLLLLPSALFTFANYPFWKAKDFISFNLSGPFLLTVAASFFSKVEITWYHYRRLLFYIIMPITSIVFLSSFHTFTSSNIIFTTNSNFTASGGFGPNQVSAILGLGALLCWLLIITEKYRSVITLLTLWLLVIWFTTQASLTFSRGGLVNFIVAAIVGTPYLALGIQQYKRPLMFCLIIIAIFAYVILPHLNEFTRGAFHERFTDMDTTNRGELVRGDLELWEDNFWFGVGTGVAEMARKSIIGRECASHTEFSRMLAEHGLLGLMALILLLIMAFRAVRQASSPQAKGLALALIIWAMLQMSHSAMRLAAISFIFSVPFARLKD